MWQKKPEMSWLEVFIMLLGMGMIGIGVLVIGPNADTIVHSSENGTLFAILGTFGLPALGCVLVWLALRQSNGSDE